MSGKTDVKEKAPAETAGTETGGNDAGNGAESEKTERLSYKRATVCLAALVFVLLAFFIGLRLIESRAERLALTADTVLQATETIPDRSLRGTAVNLNTATRDELMALPGIGEKKAQAIIDYRNEYGPFTDISEIMNVEGIGDGIYQAVKDDICV